jgi:diaminohydroxyphosphoribosylaminopyrimidine deaminase / 5-amino-6-(5-phosphoribosylamino)uracil reductase
MNDDDYMKIALDLAEKGKGYTSSNPMVGAVVVKDGQIVGSGWHRQVGGPHAEVYAIDDAGSRAKGATLYVTLEPCNHYGKTPPCTDKIIASGIKRVVMAMTDPNPDVAGGGADRLKQADISVTSGVCEEEAQHLNEIFIKYVKTKRPFVILKMAATLDGRIATRTGDSKWVSGEASRKHVHELRHLVDAVMVGVNTVKADDPQLTTRLKDKKGINPRRIILDTALSIPETAKVLQNDSPSDTIIITGNSAYSDKRNRLEKMGVQVVEAQLTDNLIDLNDLMIRLGRMRITSLLIEGGSRVAASALKAGIVDKICFFYAPKILGGDDGVPMFGGPGPELMSQSIVIKNITLHRFDDDVMIEGYINNVHRHH